MGMDDPHVHVFCDGKDCGAETEVGMTALVRNSWDLRNAEKSLKRDGWTIKDGNYFCDECSNYSVDVE